jgi:hypothetical protein
MKKLSILAASLALSCVAMPSIAAANPIITFDGRSGAFQNTNIAAGEFDDSFTFSVADMGVVSGTITSVAVDFITDVNLSSVMLNGVEFTNLLQGETEFRSLLRLPVAGGAQTLRVRGESGGNGSYAGTLAYTASQVPEPAGWTTMVLALGLLGAGLKMSARRSRREAEAA